MTKAVWQAASQLGKSLQMTLAFLLVDRCNADGGFQNRAGRSDLYYTTFALHALTAAGAETSPQTAQYLQGFGDGDSLDFIHLACLARAWACAFGQPHPSREGIAQRLETFRRSDGGYSHDHGGGTSAYGCFLALGAYQDLDFELPGTDKLLSAMELLRCDDGGYANTRGGPATVPATAAAMVTLRHLGARATGKSANWLLSTFRQGGFPAAPVLPTPDLLSTATAIHALATARAFPEHLAMEALDFINSLWSDAGAFRGHAGDAALDCEYTFYGLLALGHFS